MTKPRAGVSLALAILVMAIGRVAVSAGADDVIRFVRVIAGERANVLLDGSRATTCVNDEPHKIVFTLPGPQDITVGNMFSGTCRSEIAVFARDHAMLLLAPRSTWTTRSGDVMAVGAKPRLQVPLVIRILKAPFGDMKLRAAEEIAQASFLYNLNAGGVMFSPITYIDMTTRAGAPAALNNDCFDMSSFIALGFTSGKLNVYYINQLGTTAARGHYCVDDNTNVILIPANFAELDSLAHEIGHAFSLEHTNVIDPMTGLSTGLAADNLMLTSVSSRSTITNGQVFRVNTNASSMLNQNHNRSGSTRVCADSDISDSCPALALDLTPK